MVDAARGASAAHGDRGHPALRLRAVRQEGLLAHLARRAARRRPASSTAGVDRVITMNLHAPQVHGFFSVPVDHLTSLGELAAHFREQDLTDSVVVSPDLGNAKDATQFSRLLGLPVAAGVQAPPGGRPGRHRLHRRRRVRTAGHRPRRRDRHRRQRSSSCSTGSPTTASPRPPWPAPTGSSRAAPSSGCSAHPMITEVVTTDTVPGTGRVARAAGAVGGRGVRRGHPADPRR